MPRIIHVAHILWNVFSWVCVQLFFCPSGFVRWPQGKSTRTYLIKWVHNNDAIMGAIASQITSLTIVCSIVYADADQRKHQRSASLAFVRRIHRRPLNSPHKLPVTQKMFPFDDVIMSHIWCQLPCYSHIYSQSSAWKDVAWQHVRLFALKSIKTKSSLVICDIWLL